MSPALALPCQLYNEMTKTRIFLPKILKNSDNREKCCKHEKDHPKLELYRG